jgi:hypothetical protein
MKKKIVIALIVLALLSLGYIIFKVKKNKQTPPLNEPFISQPKIPNETQAKFTVNLQISQKDFSFASRLPVIQKRLSPIPIDTIKSIASKIGFDTDPTSINDVTYGTTYFFNNTIKSLSMVAYPNTGIIDYSAGSPNSAINKQLSDNSIIALAKNFLENNGFPNTDKLSDSSLIFIKINNSEELSLTSRDNADYYQVNFSPSISDIPVVTLNPLDSIIYVQILPDGTVSRIHYINPEGLSITREQYKIKNYEEFTSSVNNSILVSLANGSYPINDLQTDSLKNMSVQLYLPALSETL